MSPKLAICIPTYNRAQFLGELLESIINQAPTDGTLEICISDNHSTDSTEETVEIYRSRFQYITYHLNSQNLGADRNYLKCIEIATAEYCWFMGSDDKLTESAVATILAILQDTDYAIVLCNRYIWYKGINIVGEQSWQDNTVNSMLYNLHETQDFKRYCDHAMGLGSLFSYLSSIILKKDLWSKNLLGSESFIGSAYVHVYVIFQMIKSCSPFYLYYLDKPLILCRTHNDSFLDNSDILARKKLDIVGYERLSQIFSDAQESKQEMVLSVLFKDIFQSKSFYKLLYYAANSPKHSLHETLACTDRHKQLIKVSRNLRIINILYSIPLIKKLVKLLVFIRNKVIRKIIIKY
jgi:abequosyltransferase